MTTSLKSRLLTVFFLILGALFALSMYNILLAKSFSDATNTLFNQLSATAKISVKLNETHQALANLLNYKNPELLPSVEGQLSDLVAYAKSVDPLIHRSAEAAGDINLFYRYIEIQNALYGYRDKAGILAAMASREGNRLVMYNTLYELGDGKAKINEGLAGLLIRQMVTIDSLYAEYAKRIGLQIIVSLAITLMITVLMFAFSLWTAGTVSRPIEALANRAMRAKLGDFGPARRPAPSFPEVDFLVDEFDGMIEKIRVFIEELREKSDLEKRFAEEEIKTLRAENLLREAELRLLQSQINPHFLFNTINTIVTLARIEEAEYTASLLDDMARILRYSLRAVQETGTVGEELEILRTYLRIQSARFGDRLSVSLEAPQESLDFSIPAMLLQPLAENAMNHGIEPKMGPARLDIRIRIAGHAEDQWLELTVSDDGVGMEKATLQRLRSLGNEEDGVRNGNHGIANVVRRLALTYGDPGIRFESEPGMGTTVTIRLPVRRCGSGSGTRSDACPSSS